MEALSGAVGHDGRRAAAALAVGEHGATLGRCTLVGCTAAGYRCPSPIEIAWVLRFVFDDRSDPQPASMHLAAIAAALDRGDTARARRLGARFPIDALDEERVARLDLAAHLIKANYDPQESRDAQGRWTAGAAAGAAATAAASVATAAAEAGAASAFGPIGKAVTGLLAELGGAIVTPIAILGGVLIPTNRSNVSEGTVPDRPDAAYRYDEGVLSLYAVDPEGHRDLVFSGLAGSDGLYRDDRGRIVGRNLGTGFILDPTYLSARASRDRAAQRSDAETWSEAETDSDKPEVCPDRGPDIPGNKSARAIRYQEQISKLPPGLAVKFRGVTFDGCRENDGVMLEAKGPGYEWALGRPKEWREKKWAGYTDIMEQAQAQSKAAPERRIEWHFAEKKMADFFREEFRSAGFNNITVIHTPMEEP